MNIFIAEGDGGKKNIDLKICIEQNADAMVVSFNINRSASPSTTGKCSSSILILAPPISRLISLFPYPMSELQSNIMMPPHTVKLQPIKS